ncbi:MAG: aryl-sulfate sulfotransferase [Bryobacteraceae bacterium]
MRSLPMIASLAILAVDAWGQTCTPPTPVFSPPVVPAGETQPLELNGFARTTDQLPTFVMASSIYSATGFPWVDCKEQTLTRITSTNTFLGLSPVLSSGDYLVYETGLTSGRVAEVVNEWSMKSANKQAPITSQQPLLDWNHEATRIPNARTAVIGHEEMMVTSTTQCPTAQFPTNYCDILGDKVVVMNSSGTVEWVWDSFDAAQFPYINRRAILGETCVPEPNSCPITLAPIAQDWLHANSVWYDSADGNLVINLRNQNWIVKVAYQNGTGNGSVVWILGKDGNFTMEPTSIPDPWEDHPHDVTSPRPGTYSMFDNGNGRHASSGGLSRGLVYEIDESALTVTGVDAYPLGVYSPGAGSAQLLTEGKWMFMAGRPQNASGIYSEEFEFAPNTTVPLWTETLPEQYRAIRLVSLFAY